MKDLAVAAAEAEDEYTLGVDELHELVTMGMASEMRVRDALLRIAALEERRARLAQTKMAVIDRYDHALAAVERQIDRFRQAVETWIVEANGGKAVSFPDVGTAYLQAQKPRVEVADRDAFERWATERRYVREVVDLALAKAEALRLIQETGEIAPGAEYVPERKALRIRRA